MQANEQSIYANIKLGFPVANIKTVVYLVRNAW